MGINTKVRNMLLAENPIHTKKEILHCIHAYALGVGCISHGRAPAYERGRIRVAVRISTALAMLDCRVWRIS